MWSNPPTRLVCWFSCGATSAVATKLALDKFRGHIETAVVYCDTGSEHPDNDRFIKDCERYFEHEVTILKSDKYSDIWDVFDKTKYLSGVKGARCTTELKKMVRRDYEDLENDLQVFGFDASEEGRISRFKENNPEVRCYFPLHTHGLKKQDCLDILMDWGINLPTMYKLGYKNNNCLGCVKGGAGYWNKIRKDFPDVFNRMAEQERLIGAAICRLNKNGKKINVYLDELDPEIGRYESELETMKCGLICGE